MIKSIVDFAKRYGIKTIAEFVENEELYILVKELNIDYSQGFYFGRPIPFEEIMKYPDIEATNKTNQNMTLLLFNLFPINITHLKF